MARTNNKPVAKERPDKQKPSKQSPRIASRGSGSAGAGKIKITMLPIDQLRPSGWNPNILPDKERKGLREEMQRTGKVAKPILVFKAGKWYLIFDGEQTWHEAKDVGFREVPCVISDVSRLEAMRQTIIRNRHGKENPVLLGRLYTRMLEEGGLSNRDLGKLLGITEGTVRNYLLYVTAFELRNDYAADGAFELISGLKTKQVVTYLALMKLDKKVGNDWLDAGGDLLRAETLLPPKENSAAEHPDGDGQRDTAESAQDADADQQAAPADQQGAMPRDIVMPFPEGHDHEEADAAGPDAADTIDDTQADGSAIEGDGEVAPSNSTDQTIEPFDLQILDNLNNVWASANAATRSKFIATMLADPITLTVVRTIIKQGT